MGRRKRANPRKSHLAMPAPKLGDWIEVYFGGSRRYYVAKATKLIDSEMANVLFENGEAKHINLIVTCWRYARTKADRSSRRQAPYTCSKPSVLLKIPLTQEAMTAGSAPQPQPLSAVDNSVAQEPNPFQGMKCQLMSQASLSTRPDTHLEKRPLSLAMVSEMMLKEAQKSAAPIREEQAPINRKIARSLELTTGLLDAVRNGYNDHRTEMLALDKRLKQVENRLVQTVPSEETDFQLWTVLSDTPAITNTGIVTTAIKSSRNSISPNIEIAHPDQNISNKLQVANLPNSVEDVYLPMSVSNQLYSRAKNSTDIALLEQVFDSSSPSGNDMDEAVGSLASKWLVEIRPRTLLPRKNEQMNAWVRICTEQCLAYAAEQLRVLGSLEVVLAFIASSTVSHPYSWTWLLQTNTEEYRLAKYNYRAWEEPMARREWAAERALLNKIGARYQHNRSVLHQTHIGVASSFPENN